MQRLERHYKEDFSLYIDTYDPHETWDAPVYYTEHYWPEYDGETIEPICSLWRDVPGFTQEYFLSVVRKLIGKYGNC